MKDWHRQHAVPGRALVIATSTGIEPQQRIFTPALDANAEEIAESYRKRGWHVDLYLRADVSAELNAA